MHMVYASPFPGIYKRCRQQDFKYVVSKQAEIAVDKEMAERDSGNGRYVRMRVVGPVLDWIGDNLIWFETTNMIT